MITRVWLLFEHKPRDHEREGAAGRRRLDRTAVRPGWQAATMRPALKWRQDRMGPELQASRQVSALHIAGVAAIGAARCSVWSQILTRSPRSCKSGPARHCPPTDPHRWR